MWHPDKPYPESALQEAAATYLNGLESRGVLAVHHSPNGGIRHKRAGARLKRHGTKAGHPDLDIHLPGGSTVFIELKTITGRVEAPQKARHAIMEALGFDVHVVRARTPAECVKQIAEILKAYGVST